MEDPSVFFPLLSAFSLAERPPTPLPVHNIVFIVVADHMHCAALNSTRPKRLQVCSMVPLCLEDSFTFVPQILVQKQSC
jgi:hypothetical protein